MILNKQIKVREYTKSHLQQKSHLTYSRKMTAVRTIPHETKTVITSPSRRLIIKQNRWLTLADVPARAQDLLKYSKSRISDLRSALNLLSKILGKPLSELPADPEPVRRMFDEAPWQLHGVGKARWANVKSLIVGALYDIGVLSMRSRQRVCYSPSWQALLDKADDRSVRHGLSRFARWCSSRSLDPAQVKLDTFEQFARDLELSSTIRDPRERMHIARRAWNRAVEKVPGWPQLSVPSPEDSRRYALSWSSFPESLQRDIDQYQRSRGEQGLLDTDHRLIKPHTVRQHVDLLRRFASLLVKDGVNPAELASLPTLLEPTLVKRGLRLLLADNGNTRTPKAAATVGAICSVARYIDMPDGLLAELRKWEKKLRQRPSGMNEKNKRRLAPLKDASTMRKLSLLPTRIADELSKLKALTYSDATRMRFALAIEILQMAPMRVSNLAALDLEHHVGQIIDGEIHISVPANEVKNKVDLDYCLPQPTVQMVELYRQKYRPLLMDTPSSALFPSRTGGAMTSNSLARCIRRGIKRELGLLVNAHLFRHIGALLYLSLHPGDYETVRRLLGHKSITTTIAFYAGMETEHSLRRFDSAVLQLRQNGILLEDDPDAIHL
jgi:site-specific recombinase XerD